MGISVVDAFKFKLSSVESKDKLKCMIETCLFESNESFIELFLLESVNLTDSEILDVIDEIQTEKIINIYRKLI